MNKHYTNILLHVQFVTKVRLRDLGVRCLPRVVEVADSNPTNGSRESFFPVNCLAIYSLARYWHGASMCSVAGTFATRWRLKAAEKLGQTPAWRAQF